MRDLITLFEVALTEDPMLAIALLGQGMRFPDDVVRIEIFRLDAKSLGHRRVFWAKVRNMRVLSERIGCRAAGILFVSSRRVLP